MPPRLILPLLLTLFSQNRAPFPYLQSPNAQPSLNLSFPASSWTRKPTATIVVPAGDNLQGSAGLVRGTRTLLGVAQIRLYF